MGRQAYRQMEQTNRKIDGRTDRKKGGKRMLFIHSQQTVVKIVKTGCEA